MKNFYLLFFSLAILFSSESIRADGHGEKKEVVEEKKTIERAANDPRNK